MVTKNTNNDGETLSSSGHKLGQLIGDWWETRVIFPLLSEVAQTLGLFLDNRIVSRTSRSGKILWRDLEGNYVDYDYVLELGGTAESTGVPVAFLESFWRRGSRHSKDKARDDTNKLLPMRETYPTARFLAIAACGEFTEPAKEYVRTRNVELFYIGKEKIVEAFQTIGGIIEYPDSLPEPQKAQLVEQLEVIFTGQNQKTAATNLKLIAGPTAFSSFKQRIISALTATPQEIRIFSLTRCGPVIFNSIQSATEFLANDSPQFPTQGEFSQFEYEVSFSDGSEFSRTLTSIDEVRNVNRQLQALVTHINQLSL